MLSSYAECHIQALNAERRYAECPNAERPYAECHCAECHYADVVMLSVVAPLTDTFNIKTNLALV